MNNHRRPIMVSIGIMLIYTFTVILQQIVLVPVFSAFWSNELYSSWLVILSVSNLLVVADLGLNPLTIVRLQAALAVNTNDQKNRILRVLASSAHAYQWIILLLLCGVISTVSFFPVVAILNLSGSSNAQLGIAAFVTLLGSTMTVVTVGTAAVFRATNKIDGWNATRIFAAFLGLVTMYFAVSGGYGIVGAAVAFAFACFVEMMVAVFVLAPQALPELNEIRTSQRDQGVLEVLRDARENIIPLSAETILQSVPPFIMALVNVSPTGVIVYSLIRLLISVLRQFSHVVMYPLSSLIGQAWAREDKASSKEIVFACLSIMGGGLGCGVGFIWSYRFSVFEIWTKGQYSVDSWVMGVMLAGVATSFPAIVAQNALIFIGKPKVVAVSRGFQVAFLILFCTVLGYLFDLQGIVLAVVVSEIAAFSIILANCLKSTFEIPLQRFLWVSIFPFFALLSISLVSAAFAQWVIPPVNTRQFVLSFGVWLLPPLFCFGVVFYLSTAGLKLTAKN